MDAKASATYILHTLQQDANKNISKEYDRASIKSSHSAICCTQALYYVNCYTQCLNLVLADTAITIPQISEVLH